MSADEIRRLVRIYSAKEKNLKNQLEKFKETEMKPNLENITIARNDAIMTINALLAYAAIVDKCEKARRKLVAMTDKNSPTWSFDGHVAALDDIDKIDYILKGATDERK